MNPGSHVTVAPEPEPEPSVVEEPEASPLPTQIDPSPQPTQTETSVGVAPRDEVDHDGFSWDGLAAIGTLLAVVLALGIAVWDIVRTKWLAELNEDAQLQEQATAIVAWGEEDPTTGRATWRVSVYNGSNRPVFDVAVELPDGLGTLNFPVVLPHERAEGPSELDFRSGLQLQRSRRRERLDFVFVDSGGRRWHRPAAGRSQEAQGDTVLAQQMFGEAPREPSRLYRAVRRRLGYARAHWR